MDLVTTLVMKRVTMGDRGEGCRILRDGINGRPQTVLKQELVFYLFSVEVRISKERAAGTSERHLKGEKETLVKICTT